jgi:succinoglycan biosynthesis protein ExoM
MLLSVCICTFKRPALLNELLHALREQQSEEPFEIVVVDNDPAGSATAVLKAQQQYWGDRLICRHISAANISVARNEAISVARGDWLAMIDDDELPENDWLAQLRSAQQCYSAAVVFAPVVPRYLPDTPDWLIKGGYFDRPRLASGTLINHKNARSGNVFIMRDVLLKLGLNQGFIFDPEFGRTGGEDSLLFRQLELAGAKMVWCDEAPVTEVVPADRANARWLLKRSFRTGGLFLKTELIMAAPEKRRLTGLKLGLRAIVQAAIASFLAVILSPVRPLKAFHWARVVASQLGKLAAYSHPPAQAYGTESEKK